MASIRKSSLNQTARGGHWFRVDSGLREAAGIGAGYSKRGSCAVERVAGARGAGGFEAGAGV